MILVNVFGNDKSAIMSRITNDPRTPFLNIFCVFIMNYLHYILNV